jgi:hypothetical protein
MQHHPSQFLLKLTQTVTIERGISLVCISAYPLCEFTPTQIHRLLKNAKCQ